MRFFNQVLIFVILPFCLKGQEKIKVILDADTANEVDDPYALVRALLEPSWDITALNAAHWQTSHWATDDSMEDSHRLNQVILGYMGLNIPTKRGAAARMYDWGDMAQHSAASYEIIRQARDLDEGERLHVIALGALTNVASAIYIEPQIQDQLVLHWLGTTYDFDNDVLRKNDFNCVMDIQALDYLLFSRVEMHIIPVSVAMKMTFSFEDTKQRIAGLHPVCDFLIRQWEDHKDGGGAQLGHQI